MSESPVLDVAVRVPGANDNIRRSHRMSRIALVTGAAGGLGLAVTRQLADDTSWVTGQVLSVDGGFTAVRPMVRAAAAP